MTTARPRQAMLITGAARRIGAIMARSMAADGWFICIHCNTARQEADALLAEIEAGGGSGLVMVQDLADPAAPHKLVQAVVKQAPPLTVLVNNASLFAFDDVTTVTADALDRNHAVNLRTPVLLSQAFHAQLPALQTGCIVNMLDNKVFAVNPDYLSYTISKFALHGATQALAQALGPRIRVNGIAPGITLASDGQDQESFERGQSMSPLGRVSSPEDIVQAMRFILATSTLNGHVIVIDGGQNLQKFPRDVAFMPHTKPARN